MRQLASRRGEAVLGPQDWHRLPRSSLDGAISAFVLHYGVSTADFGQIARQLRPGAYFAANYFKGDDAAIELLTQEIRGVGLALEYKAELLTTRGASNPLLVFRKSDRQC